MAQGFNPSGLKAPFGAFSHAAWAPAGRTLYISGQVATDGEGRVVGEGDMRAQTEQTLRNIATVLRLHRGEPLAADKLRIELTPLHGDWVLVSDAWSFPEGEARRWSRARFGEFRVDADGRALLVGLRGENLEQL